MEGISDIRICGVDETRPPRIRKEPYIDIYFKLSHQAPKAWCEDFNRLNAKKGHAVKIDSSRGLFIETWVRQPEEIPPLLESLKQAVTACNEQYIRRIEEEARAAASANAAPGDEGEQGRLNRIIASLNFED
ncbi:MAG: hypothetical protein RI563_10905 [Thiohalophilus sp.]|uniref:hypothetical protein n=1 Tax=Thiohalophilus sp. TaxID=3028392 RepID=UPI00287082F8|nr:hypothetical protein [Thiohalophilus sp.]MDR9437386.1 hypothetical protein [Thiohalophilus sp.]